MKYIVLLPIFLFLSCKEFSNLDNIKDIKLIEKHQTHTSEILVHSIANNNLDLQNIINIDCGKIESLSWNEKPSEIFDIIEEINSEIQNEYLQKVLQNYENTEVLINGCFYTTKNSSTTYPFFEYFVIIDKYQKKIFEVKYIGQNY